MDHLHIGSTPNDEPCAQVGQDNYRKLSVIECIVFINQLYRQFPLPENTPGRLRTLSQFHDFGTYREVVAVYDPDNEESCKWAFAVECDTPAHWDSEALAELAAHNYLVVEGKVTYGGQ